MTFPRLESSLVMLSSSKVDFKYSVAASKYDCSSVSSSFKSNGIRRLFFNTSNCVVAGEVDGVLVPVVGVVLVVGSVVGVVEPVEPVVLPVVGVVVAGVVVCVGALTALIVNGKLKLSSQLISLGKDTEAVSVFVALMASDTVLEYAVWYVKAPSVSKI